MTATGSPAAQLLGFKRHLKAEVVAGEAVYLFSERGVTALKGSHLEALAPLLDGTRDLPTLLRAMSPDVAPEQVGGLIARLDEAGLVALRPHAEGGDDHSLAYWEASGLDATTAAADIAGKQIQLITVGNLDGSAARRATGLAVTAGTGCLPEGTADLSVVLCEDYLAPVLADVDAAHRAVNRPWLLAKPVGAQVWIGPVFQPAGQACWHCLAARLWGHRQAEAHVQAALGRRDPVPRPFATVPALAATAMHLIALEATKWLAGYRYPGQHSVWTFDSLDLRERHHELRRRPQCAACGDPTHMRAQASRPVVIAPRPKACTSGGGHRSMPPEEVLDTYRHLVSPVTGVIKEIRRDKRGPAFFNSFRAGANLALGARSLESLREALRIENGGKGITALHGEVSALCEALERHCGYFQGDEERIRGSFRTLGDQAIHPDTCQLYHERQYENRATWNAAHAPFQYVCDPFDDDAVMDWTPVWSLTEQRHRLLPTRMLYFGVPTNQGSFSVRADSNGNAAGSSIEDAILQGLLEIVERDAVALWWYNRTRQPAVDLGAFCDPWIEELRAVYAGLGREVWVLDVTSDLHIPTMVALSRRTDRRREDIMFGFGAHLDPHVALRRALTELNQLMPAIVDGNPEEGYGCSDMDAVHWWRHATVRNQPYLVPDPDQPQRVPSDFGYTPQPDLREDVKAVQAGLESRGMDLLVLDQTRPDIGLPVVKVIVPGMRSFWARFAPGRLYDVPVRLGRLAEPTPYDCLNPHPMFL